MFVTTRSRTRTLAAGLALFGTLAAGCSSPAPSAPNAPTKALGLAAKSVSVDRYAGCPTSSRGSDIAGKTTMRERADGASLFQICKDSVDQARGPQSAAAIKKALSRLGVRYSQPNRDKPGYYDCSSFVSWAYRDTGTPVLGLKGWTPTTYTFLSNSVGGFKTVGVGDRRPGDLVFPHNGHVAMQLAGGLIVHTNATGDVSHIKNAYSSPASVVALTSQSAATPRSSSRDFDMNGRDDVGVIVPDAKGLASFHVLLTGSDGKANQRVDYGWSGYWGAAGVKTTVGDFTGDGRADFGVAVKNPNGLASFYVLETGANGKINRMIDYGWGGYWGFAGINITAGDFTGDGRADFGVAVKNPNGLASFYVLETGSNIKINRMLDYGWGGYWGFAGIKISAGDFTRDGRADFNIATNNPNGLASFYVLETGSNIKINRMLDYGWAGYWGWAPIQVSS